MGRCETTTVASSACAGDADGKAQIFARPCAQTVRTATVRITTQRTATKMFLAFAGALHGGDKGRGLQSLDKLRRTMPGALASIFPEFDGFVGSGRFGDIFGTNDKTKVVKVVKIGSFVDSARMKEPMVEMADFMDEAKVAMVCGDAGASPRVHWVFTDRAHGAYVMDRWEGDALTYIDSIMRMRKKTAPEQFDLILRAFGESVFARVEKVLESAGFVPGDVRLENVLYRTNEEGKEEFCLTDLDPAVRSMRPPPGDERASAGMRALALAYIDMTLSILSYVFADPKAELSYTAIFPQVGSLWSHRSVSPDALSHRHTIMADKMYELWVEKSGGDYIRESGLIDRDHGMYGTWDQLLRVPGPIGLFLPGTREQWSKGYSFDVLNALYSRKPPTVD